MLLQLTLNCANTTTPHYIGKILIKLLCVILFHVYLLFHICPFSGLFSLVKCECLVQVDVFLGSSSSILHTAYAYTLYNFWVWLRSLMLNTTTRATELATIECDHDRYLPVLAKKIWFFILFCCLCRRQQLQHKREDFELLPKKSKELEKHENWLHLNAWQGCNSFNCSRQMLSAFYFSLWNLITLFIFFFHDIKLDLFGDWRNRSTLMGLSCTVIVRRQTRIRRHLETCKYLFNCPFFFKTLNRQTLLNFYNVCTAAQFLVRVAKFSTTLQCEPPEKWKKNLIYKISLKNIISRAIDRLSIWPEASTTTAAATRKCCYYAVHFDLISSTPFAKKIKWAWARAIIKFYFISIFFTLDYVLKSCCRRHWWRWDCSLCAAVISEWSTPYVSAKSES